MPIKPSSASEVRALVEALGGADDVRREGAIARLAVIGARAADRLIVVFDAADTSRTTRIGILRVFEAAGVVRSFHVERSVLQYG
jgi:hypothetical protein